MADLAGQSEKHWQATLALAGTPREKAELWQMVGIKRDALAAMSAIAAVDPGSRLNALLAVREINRVEFRRESQAPLERLAAQLAEAPQTDRPWLLDLVAAHAAALRGDLAATRARLDRALHGAPKGADLVRPGPRDPVPRPRAGVAPRGGGPRRVLRSLSDTATTPSFSRSAGGAGTGPGTADAARAAGHRAGTGQRSPASRPDPAAPVSGSA